MLSLSPVWASPLALGWVRVTYGHVEAPGRVDLQWPAQASAIQEHPGHTHTLYHLIPKIINPKHGECVLFALAN